MKNSENILKESNLSNLSISLNLEKIKEQCENTQKNNNDFKSDYLKKLINNNK